MIMIKDKIQIDLLNALEKIGVKNEKPNLETPNNFVFGDYSSSIALKLGKTLHENPLEVAKKIIDNLPKNEAVEKVSLLKPGFINFWLKQDILNRNLKDVFENKIEIGSWHLGSNKKIMVEFAHPNTHKLFHIGHLRNITTGETIVRILETLGNKVIRANYQGDVGMHIAKCIYQLKKQPIKNLKTIREKIKFLGDAYAEGNKAYETDEKAKQEIIKINQRIYDKSDKEINSLWIETRQWSLDYFKEIYQRVYTHYDRLFFESELPEGGVEIAKEALNKGILEKSEGAIVFNGKKHGLDTRVFINSLGLPTYEGKELALAEKEFSEFGNLDKNIHVVGPEQASFFKVTIKVEELLNPEKYKNRQLHLIYGWVNLKTGKMSSRQGNVIEGEWLLNETKKTIKENFKCVDDVAETLAVAAVKYSFLRNGLQNTIAFDLKESISLDGNSGIYLLYTYVRCQSILRKHNTNIRSIDISTLPAGRQIDHNLEQEEIDLLRTLVKYPDVVYEAGKNFAPNFIANYLYDLAQRFNLFYQKHSVLQSDDEVKQFRLALTQATANILKKGLDLLGIKTVERM
jgi:arginyl-tRNA synthetase